MLGFHFNVHEKTDDFAFIETEFARYPNLAFENRLMSWDSTLPGLQWVDELIEADKMIQLAHNGGYPLVYECSADDFLLLKNNFSGMKPGSLQLLNEPRSGTRLIVVAWDQS